MQALALHGKAQLKRLQDDDDDEGDCLPVLHHLTEPVHVLAR